MKLQCACGAKYAFDITPDMARPVKFVCPACGLDSSDYVNNLVNKELGLALPVGMAPSGTSPAPKPVVPSAPIPPLSTGLRIQSHAPTPAAPVVSEPTSGEGEPQLCAKHPDEYVTDKCFVCSKPICPKCMQLFGYLCSPLCKAKAKSHGLNVPEYEGQASVVEAKLWRKVKALTYAGSAVVVMLLGVWGWWEWVGSNPKPLFAVRFNDPVHSGESAFCGKDQIVFLHGDILARYDMSEKKEIWSRSLVDKAHVQATAEKWHKELEDSNTKAYQNGGTEATFRVPPLADLVDEVQRSAEAALDLHARGTNIWVAEPEKLVRYDWDTGRAVKEILLRPGLASTLPRGDEFLLIETDNEKPVITHVDLATSELRKEDIAEESALAAAARRGAARGSRGGRGEELAGLPKSATDPDAGKPMDPAKVEAQAQRMSLPARIALPATLSIERNQQRAIAEMNEQDRGKNIAPPPPEPEGFLSLIPTKTGFIELTTKLLERRVVERSAMKPAPAKSALNGPVSMATEGQVANEILNDMQRANGGEAVTEDVSRYQVTIRRPEIAESWTGEVEGEPRLLPLQTVDVLTANKMIIVFDKNNKLLWKGALTYNVEGEQSPLDQDEATYGLGPCAEHNGSLYVFDQGVLTAFDLASGTARWRLPSVGIVGLFFDDQGMIYVNTSTTSPETLKYSRQIDITRQSGPVVLKVDSRTGKEMWREELGTYINYVSGKFVYAVKSYMKEENSTDERTPSFMRIKRINPRNGTVMQEEFQQRGPVDVEFDKNLVRLVFKKEVQVVKFPSL